MDILVGLFETAGVDAKRGLRNLGLTPLSFQRLVDFKLGERKDDPTRVHGIHGPFEETHLKIHGRLPDDYFAKGDPVPWGLRIEESKSNILWQILSGVMDSCPEFGSAYLALVLDKGLNRDTYINELMNLNKDWGDSFEKLGVRKDHRHQSMKSIFTRVDCAACNILTAAAIRDDGMIGEFKALIGKTREERIEYLKSKGFDVLLTFSIPETPKKGLAL
jgi:hypothetical protein